MVHRALTLAAAVVFVATACAKDPAPSPDAPGASGVTATAPDTAPPAPPEAPTEAGVRFSDGSGGFALQLPAAPTTTTKATPTEVGTVDMHTYTVEVSGSALTVSWADYPAAIMQRRSLPYMKRNQLQGLTAAYAPATVGTVEDLSVSGRPALRFELEGQGPPGTGVGRVKVAARAIYAANRLYQVMGLWKADAERPAYIDRALETFALTDGAPAGDITALTQKAWGPWKAPDGALTVDAPGAPKTRSQGVPVGDLAMKVDISVWEEGMYGMYMATVLTIPAEAASIFDPVAALAKAKTEFQARFKAQGIEEKAVGKDDLELRGKAKEGDDEVLLRGRFLWRSPRLYQFITRIGTLEDPAKVDRFFDSLKLSP